MVSILKAHDNVKEWLGFVVATLVAFIIIAGSFAVSLYIAAHAF